MGHILPFRTVARREGAPPTAQAAGEVVAMKDLDLETVITTVRFLRDIGQGHLLDGFNGQMSPSTALRSGEPLPGYRKSTRT